MPAIPSPHGHGWVVNDNTIGVDWMSKPPAPDELLMELSCGCTAGHGSGRRSCVEAAAHCTDACHCVSTDSACQNREETKSMMVDDDEE